MERVLLLISLMEIKNQKQNPVKRKELIIISIGIVSGVIKQGHRSDNNIVLPLYKLFPRQPWTTISIFYPIICWCQVPLKKVLQGKNDWQTYIRRFIDSSGDLLWNLFGDWTASVADFSYGNKKPKAESSHNDIPNTMLKNPMLRIPNFRQRITSNWLINSAPILNVLAS